MNGSMNAFKAADARGSRSERGRQEWQERERERERCAKNAQKQNSKEGMKTAERVS